MLEILTHLADWLVYGLAGLDSQIRAGAALHLYAEDANGILAPPVVLV